LQFAETNSPSDSALLASVVALAIGVALLRFSWTRRQERSWSLIVSGWLTIIAGISIYGSATSAEIGIAYGLLVLAVIAYGAVAATFEFRGHKIRVPLSAALEPEDRPTNWPRAIAKSLLAIVLAGVAAIGVGVAFAVAMPLAIHDRVILGGILVPVLWGGGMAWTLADSKLLRATILLFLISAVGYTIAFAPKFLKLL